MTSALLLLAALAVTPPASPLEGPQPARARTPGIGRVLQVTGARAYLDAGAEEGLAPGQLLTLWRGEAEAGHCAVEAVSPNSATCTGGAPRPGDAFKFSPPAAPPGAKVVVLPAPPADDELARRNAAVAAAPVAQVVDKATGPATQLAPPRPAMGEVSLTDALWSTSGGGNWDEARLDASVHGAPLGPVSVDLDLRASRWLAQGTSGVVTGSKTRFTAWQAQAAWLPADRAISLTAGRVLAWTIPGATVMDGAVVGWRGQTLEAGFFGGLVPEPDTLNPSTKRATGGGYWILDKRFSKDVVLRQEGRLAFVRSPELGDRVELEAAASAHAGRALDLFASARVGGGGKEKAPGLLDGARLETTLRPADRLTVTAGFEYGGLAVPQPLLSSFYGTRNRRADGSVFWDASGWRLGLAGGTSRDVTSKLDRSWVGPELQLPRFFTPRLALSVGYLEELGWLRGHSAFLQAVARPWDRLRLISRLSWSHDSSLGKQQDEFGLALSAVAELTDRLGLRLSTLVRTGIDLSAGDGASIPIGVNGALTLYSLF